MIWDSVPTLSVQGVANQPDSFQKIEKCPKFPAFARGFGEASRLRTRPRRKQRAERRGEKLIANGRESTRVGGQSKRMADVAFQNLPVAT